MYIDILSIFINPIVMTSKPETNLDFSFSQSTFAADGATRFLLSRGYVVFNALILIVNLGVFTGVSTSDKLLLILKQIIHEI
jgi:hypothetical protein